MKTTARIDIKKTFKGPTAEADAAAWRLRVLNAVRSIGATFEIGLSATATIREALPRFMKYKTKVDKLKPETLHTYERVLIAFANQLSGGAGDLPLETINQNMLDEWMICRAEDVGNGVIAKEVGKLKTFGRWCMGRGICGPLPLLHCVAPVAPVVEPRCMDMSELFELLRKIAKTHPQVALPLECMLRLGVRPEAVCALKWRQVKMAGNEHSGFAKFKTLKKGELSVAEIFAGGPMHDNFKRAKRFMENRRGIDTRRSFPVYVTCRGKSGRAGYGWTVSTLCNAAKSAAERHGVEGFCPYVIRHSVATHLKQSGMSAVDVQHFMDHKSAKTQETYDHTSAVDARSAFALMQGVDVEDSSVRDVGVRDIW